MVETNETLSLDDLEAAPRAAFEAEGPAFIDVQVARAANVYPMIAPGEAARNMVG